MIEYLRECLSKSKSGDKYGKLLQLTSTFLSLADTELECILNSLNQMFLNTTLTLKLP